MAASSEGGRVDGLSLVGVEGSVGAKALVGTDESVGEGTSVASLTGETGPSEPGVAHAARKTSPHALNASLIFILFLNFPDHLSQSTI